jgi:hypothetical protein
MKKSFIYTTILSMFLFACGSKDDPTPAVDCTGATPTYTNSVKAILDSNCAFSGCHNTVSKEKGHDYETYAGAKTAAGKSAFLGSINHSSGFDKMPKNSAKLSDAEIKTLTCWVNNGAPQ